ncbi:hypothetical protein FPQ18DRAFT_336053 [Pyronema domesticum]|uniref:Uncharacterized protein n=1 Tax=Pyronema omphalodes (strain CBS 100304) TaxID=1076935 RepID=U4LV38_PYROM|nr:hypothetical protein FPQ18DRAFT_336053 [Pyronema domesticum]CCX34247.1 Protein of unknown function [Pyronema omphalodes CBS 100304]
MHFINIRWHVFCSSGEPWASLHQNPTIPSLPQQVAGVYPAVDHRWHIHPAPLNVNPIPAPVSTAPPPLTTPVTVTHATGQVSVDSDNRFARRIFSYLGEAEAQAYQNGSHFTCRPPQPPSLRQRDTSWQQSQTPLPPPKAGKCRILIEQR